MASGVAHFINVLVAEEIERRVKASAINNQIIPAARWAAEIAEMYRGREFTAEEIANQIFGEATKAGIPVQLGGGSTWSLDYTGPFGRP